MDSGKYGRLDVDHMLTKMDRMQNVLDDIRQPMDPYAGVDHYGDRFDNADHMDPDMYSYLSNMDEEELVQQYREYYEQQNPGPYSEENEYYNDEYAYYGDDENYPGYYDDEYTRISLSELFDRCVVPTLGQALNTVYPLIGLCFVYRITSHFISVNEPVNSFAAKDSLRTLRHIISAACGVTALWFFFEENLVYLVMSALLCYLLLYITYRRQLQCGVSATIITTVYILTCELVVVPSTEWHRIRGAQMVLSMKIISLAFDLDSKTVSQLPDPGEYLGYVFQVGTIVFGPWISFTEYINSYNQKDRKLDFFWFWKCCRSFVMSLLYVIISTCIIQWLILDEEAFIWLLAYRDAQSFRFSHYFISSMSEATATLSGLGAIKNNGDVRWDLTVTKPFSIEVPRSLVEVVSYWNLPMHTWLKTYVFKTARPLGNFAAILLTYIASSLLHGINFQLSAVLLSLGFYSYIEYVLRKKLSRVFDACIGAKRCKHDCEHSYKSNHPYVILVNMSLGLLTVFHLAYLGVMFDSSPSEEQGYSMSHTLGKWGILGYTSHWVALATFIFYLLI